MLDVQNYLKILRLSSGTFQTHYTFPPTLLTHTHTHTHYITSHSHRPCAMVVPDFELIAEIMLVAEGFIEARILARKFLTLYTLCKELLSKQDHYDWGLRAIKSVLVVAGSLKRGDRGRPEDQVLMRALRDFNLPKIVTHDVTIIMGLIGDLFPALNVPRKRDQELEDYVKKSVIVCYMLFYITFMHSSYTIIVCFIVVL